MFKKFTLIISLLFFSEFSIANTDFSFLEEKEVFDFFDKNISKIDIEHFSYVNANAPRTGRIRYGMEGTFDTLNHHLTNGTKAIGVYLVNASAMYRSPEHIARYYPYIVKTYQVPNDYSYVIFNINEKATWSDESPITADDFVFSLKLIQTKGNTFVRVNYNDIKNIEKINDKKIKVNFKQNDRRELLIEAFRMPIFHSKQYLNIKDCDISTTPPIGAGPYKITRYALGQNIVYEKRKPYWGDDLVVFKGRANFDIVSVEYYRDNAALMQAFKAGLFDLRLEGIAKNWAKNYPGFVSKKHKLLKKKWPHTLPTGMNGFVFNTRREPFNDIEIRKAITYLLDFAWVNKNLMYNSYKRQLTFFKNTIYSSENNLPNDREIEILKEYGDAIPKEIFTEKFTLPNNEMFNTKDNLKMAFQILEKKGWSIVNNKLVNKNNEQLTIKILTQSPNIIKVLNFFASTLEKIGIKTEIHKVEQISYAKKIYNFDYDLIMQYFPLNNILGTEQVNYWHSNLANIKGSKNYAGVKNPVIDSILERLLSSKNSADLVVLARILDRLLLFNYYILPLWTLDELRFVYWDTVHPPENQPKYEIDVDSWWASDKNNIPF